MYYSALTLDLNTPYIVDIFGIIEILKLPFRAPDLSPRDNEVMRNVMFGIIVEREIIVIVRTGDVSWLWNNLKVDVKQINRQEYVF